MKIISNIGKYLLGLSGFGIFTLGGRSNGGAATAAAASFKPDGKHEF